MITVMNEKKKNPHKGQSFFLATMALFFLIHLVSLIRMLQLPNNLTNQISLVPSFEIVMSKFWLFVTIWVVTLLLRNHKNAVNRALWVSFGFIIYSVSRLLIFTQADYDRQRIIFLMVIVLGLLLLFSFASNLLRYVRKLDNN